MEEDGRKGPGRERPANDNHPPHGQDAGSGADVGERLDMVVLSIARLIGEVIAREDFEKARVERAQGQDVKLAHLRRHGAKVRAGRAAVQGSPQAPRRMGAQLEEGMGALCGCPLALLMHPCKPLAGRLVVAPIQFDAGPVTAELLGCRQCRTAAAERVQHKVAGLRESLDQRAQRLDRLLRRVVAHGLAMMKGGYRLLLHYPVKRPRK